MRLRRITFFSPQLYFVKVGLSVGVMATFKRNCWDNGVVTSGKVNIRSEQLTIYPNVGHPSIRIVLYLEAVPVVWPQIVDEHFLFSFSFQEQSDNCGRSTSKRMDDRFHYHVRRGNPQQLRFQTVRLAPFYWCGCARSRTFLQAGSAIGR